MFNEGACIPKKTPQNKFMHEKNYANFVFPFFSVVDTKLLDGLA